MYLMLFDNEEHIVSSVVPRGFWAARGLTRLAVARCSYMHIPTESRNETSVQSGKCIFICLLLVAVCQWLWFRSPKAGSMALGRTLKWFGAECVHVPPEVTDMYNVFSSAVILIVNGGRG